MGGTLVGHERKPVKLKARDKQNGRTRKVSDVKTFEENWDRIFNKKEKVND